MRRYISPAEKEAAARRSRNAGQCSLRVIHVVSAACGSCPLFPQSLHTARHTRRFAEWHDAGSFVSLTRKTNAMTKRESLMHLTPRHLDSVRSMAMGKSTIPELQKNLTESFDRYFPPLRKLKRDRVPSDALREDIMVRQILNRVQEYRDNPDPHIEAQHARDVALIQAAAAANHF